MLLSVLTHKVKKEHDALQCGLQAARVEDHGPNSVWVANPEYQRQYSLAQGVPPNLALPTSPTAQGASWANVTNFRRGNRRAVRYKVVSPVRILLDASWALNGLW